MKKTIFIFAFAIAACRTEAAPEPRPDPQDPQSQTQTNASGGPHAAAPGASYNGPSVMQVAHVPISPDDPLHGKFTLDDATKGMPAGDTLTATIDTSHGKLTCKLYGDKAPLTVANFVGLARGTRPWKDPHGTWLSKPAYDGTTFHRIIKGFMIQGGDAKGDGSGEPGYVVPDEIWVGTQHDRVGQLCMANRGPNTNGAQFFITDAAAPHLDRNHTYTIFGECEPEAVIHMIAGVPNNPANGNRPDSPVTINKITIVRKPSGAVPFAGAPLDASTHGDAP